jgi:O-antigen/teichoic acid export membrane protein
MQLKNVKAAFWAQSIQMLVQAVAFIFLARHLSPEQMGGWSFYLLLFSLAEGLRVSFVHNAWIYLSRKESTNPEEWKAAAWGLQLILTLILMPIVMLLGWGAAVYWHMPILMTLTLWYPALALMSGLFQLTQSESVNAMVFGRVRSGAFGMSLAWLLSLLFVLYGLKSNDLSYLVGGQVLSYLVGAITGGLSFPKMMPKRKHMKSLFDFGRYSAGTSIGSLLYQKTDALLLGYMLGPTAVGFYSVASRINNYIEIPLNAVTQAAFPELSESKIPSETLRKTVGLMLAASIPMALGVLIAAPLIIQILAGSAYVQAANCLRLFALMALIKPFGRMLGLLLESSGRPQLNFRIMWISAGINLVLNILFIPIWGISGAAFATLLATWITVILSRRLVGKDEAPAGLSAIKSALDYYRQFFHQLQKSIYHVNSVR